MAKRKLKDSIQVNGELPTDNLSNYQRRQVKPMSIEQVLGNDNGTSQYRFLNDPFDTDEYKAFLKKLLDSDFRKHAESFGAKYYDPADRPRIERRLIDDFEIHAARFRAPRNLHPSNKKMTPDSIKRLESIMAVGKN